MYKRDAVDQLKFGTKFCPVFADSSMEPYLRHLHTYVSVSGPHLGYIYSSNSLFNSGMWFLKKLKGTQCIHQLTCTDDPDLQKTFLYKLCKVGKCPTKFGIKWQTWAQRSCFLHAMFVLMSNWSYWLKTVFPSKISLHLKMISNVDVIFKSWYFWSLLRIPQSWWQFSGEMNSVEKSPIEWLETVFISGG